MNQISREFCNDELTLEQAFKQMKGTVEEKRTAQNTVVGNLPF